MLVTVGVQLMFSAETPFVLGLLFNLFVGVGLVWLSYWLIKGNGRAGAREREIMVLFGSNYFAVVDFLGKLYNVGFTAFSDQKIKRPETDYISESQCEKIMLQYFTKEKMFFLLYLQLECWI